MSRAELLGALRLGTLSLGGILFSMGAGCGGAGLGDAGSGDMGLLGSDTCEAPPSLPVADGAAATLAAMTGVADHGLLTACGSDASLPDVFYRIRVDEPAYVSFVLEGEAGATAALLADRCPIELHTACASAGLARLSAGTYLLGVSAPADSTFTISVGVVPVTSAEGGPGSCAEPLPLTLRPGVNTLAGTFEGARDLASVTCGPAELPEIAFTFDLAAATTLDIADLGNLATSKLLRRDDCETTPDVACANVSQPTLSAELGAGTYVLLLEPSTLEQAEFGLAIVLPEGDPSDSEPIPGSDTCTEPSTLSLTDGAIVFSSSVAAASADGLAASCDLDASQPDVFFQIAVSETSFVTFVLAGDPAAQAALLADRCPIERLSVCGTAATLELEAGVYVLGVTTPVGTDFELSVAVTSVDGRVGSCTDPLPIDLSAGPVTVTGTWSTFGDHVLASCSPTAQADAVYTFTLAAAADITITNNAGSEATRILRNAPCSSPDIACTDSWEPVLLVPNQPAGTYDVIIEQDYDYYSNYSVTIEASAPTPRPANDRCTGAAALSFVGDVATTTANFTSVVPEVGTGFCGSATALYYAFTLDESRELQVEVSSYYVAAEILEGPCGSPSSLYCDTSTSQCTAALSAGDYLLRVAEDYYEPLLDDVTVTLTQRVPPTTPAHDLCSVAEPLVFDGVGEATASSTLAGAGNDLTFASCGSVYSGGGAEVFYGFTLAEESDLVIDLSDAPAYSDMQIVVFADGCVTPTVVDCDRSLYASEAIRAYNVPAGNYQIAVEFYDVPYLWSGCRDATTDRFTLGVTATPSPPPPANDTCGGATVISFPGVPSAAAVVGTTRGAANDVASVTCPGDTYATTAAGGDVVYQLVVPELARVRVTPVSSSFDIFMTLTSEPCLSAGPVACSDYFSLYPLETSFALSAGTYYLNVDQHVYVGDDPIPGDFTLTVELLAP